MAHAVWDPFAAYPRAPEQRPPQPATIQSDGGARGRRPYEGDSFSAGRECGTRVAACLARLAALELIDGSRWWNRRRRRLMASALIACAEELEDAADQVPPAVSPPPAPARTRSGRPSG